MNTKKWKGAIIRADGDHPGRFDRFRGRTGKEASSSLRLG